MRLSLPEWRWGGSAYRSERPPRSAGGASGSSAGGRAAGAKWAPALARSGAGVPRGAWKWSRPSLCCGEADGGRTNLTPGSVAARLGAASPRRQSICPIPL